MRRQFEEGRKRAASVPSGGDTFTYKGLEGEAARRAKAAGFAEGGMIMEPTLLIATKTGGVGIMAEKGPEAIVPQRAPFGFRHRPIEVHVHIGNVSKDVDIQKIINAVKSALQGGHSRGGIIG